MTDASVTKNWRKAQIAVGESLGLGWRALGRPWRLLTSLRSRTPERLLISPQDIRTADPTVAADIYAGYFSFAGKSLNAHGRSPFEIVPASPAWAAALVGFGWLRHMRAADTALARANARVLVDDFLTLAAGNPALPVWEPKVAARRLLSWLSQSPMILDGADRAFYQRFMKALGRHGAMLQLALADGLKGEARLCVAIALAELGLCSAGMEAQQKRSTRLLSEELRKQILPDGGHISRNPQALIDFLLDLLPLRQAYAARSIVAPQELLNAVDRMLPMLRMFRHGDGSIALFNGMGATAPHVLATLLAYDDTRAAATANAPNTGYQRMEASGCVLIMDTGAPPPMDFSERGHAGQLSFEWSVDGYRFVGNCGAPDEARGGMRLASRTTAAHSTLVVADTSSSRFGQAGGLARRLDGRILPGMRNVQVSRETSATMSAITASHDGFAREFGLTHQRTLNLASDGSRLMGTDHLIASSGRRASAVDYALRFHLHPYVRAQKADDGRSVWLWLPNDAVWRFDANGLPVELEPSIFFAAMDSASGAEQIVVSTDTAQSPGVEWKFSKVS